MSIESNISQLRQQLPPEVRLVCVSKYHSIAEIEQAYRLGERDFGESRAKELTIKAAALPQDIRWHFIGHLQRNKLKQVVPLVSMIQSVDSWRLLEAINKTAAAGQTVDVLLEVHVAKEQTKTGLTPEQLQELLTTQPWQQLSNIRISGLMGMATQTDDNQLLKQEFGMLNDIFAKTKEQFFADSDSFSILSMGMSHDYRIAIQEGSNMVRIGSSIFN